MCQSIHFHYIDSYYGRRDRLSVCRLSRKRDLLVLVTNASAGLLRAETTQKPKDTETQAAQLPQCSEGHRQKHWLSSHTSSLVSESRRSNRGAGNYREGRIWKQDKPKYCSANLFSSLSHQSSLSGSYIPLLSIIKLPRFSDNNIKITHSSHALKQSSLEIAQENAALLELNRDYFFCASKQDNPSRNHYTQLIYTLAD